MFRFLNNRIGTTIAVMILVAAGAADHASADATRFVQPGYWNVGDLNTTYQDWGTFNSVTAATPNLGYHANPAIGAGPTTAADSPAAIAGSGNYYSFNGDYGFSADIYNHGGSFGAVVLPAGSGTHVIVQISSTLNGDDGVYSDTVEIVDLAGDPLTGGANGSALRHEVMFEGLVLTSFGEVIQREEIWEFFLPDYVGDFRVQGDVIVHSSFDQIRVDSAISSVAFAPTNVPEPATMALIGLGSTLAFVRRRR